MVAVSSWGNLSARKHRIIRLTSSHHAVLQLQQQASAGIAFGMGRSYGDICLNPDGLLWDTSGLNHYISFDHETGILRCEAGVLLQDIQRLMIPRGWILPVTPGTQLITVGGAIANDVHGKNHHSQGSFGHHVTWLKLIRTDGQIIECGPLAKHSEWFFATVGGMGLTGIIAEVEIQLQRTLGPWLDTETVPYNNLTEFFALSDESFHFDYTVSWFDCLQQQSCRGIFMRAHAAQSTNEKYFSPKRKVTIPCTPPISLINPITLRLFNSLYYYGKKWCPSKKIMHYESFLYPLDNLGAWNRLYGCRGFFQYQCVIPHDVRQDAMQVILKEIARVKIGSFLTVLKTFGTRESLGMMSFPLPKGVTLALDFPNQGEKTLGLLNRLDSIVREAGGRIYLAKDARMSREMFIASYPNLNNFLQYRDPGMSSAMSRRLIRG
jgi:FAD/FMN-containing dehydrogenase